MNQHSQSCVRCGDVPPARLALREPPLWGEGHPLRDIIINNILAAPAASAFSVSRIGDWDSFYRAAIAHFREEPSEQTLRKLKDRHAHGLLTIGLVDIIAHVRAMPERYELTDWCGGEYRPPFRATTGDPIDGFVPRTLRQLARDPLRCISNLYGYIAHHGAACQERLLILNHDFAADVALAEGPLEWAANQSDPAFAIFEDYGFERRAVGVPAWPICWWIMPRARDLNLGPYATKFADLMHRARTELAARPSGVPDCVLSLLGVAPLTDAGRQEREAEIRTLEDEIAWAQGAIGHLDEIVNGEPETSPGGNQ